MSSALAASRHRLSSGAEAAAILSGLLERWTEPHRRYHDRSHLDAALAAVDNFDLSGHQRIIVDWALWYHDAIYDSTAADNEARSSALACSELGDMLPADDVSEIVRLIDLTAHHSVEQKDRLGAVMVDVDLSILGAEPDVYDAYTRGVRYEYSHRSDHEFQSGRLAFLEGMITRKHLFNTDRGADLWETKARTNLEREAASLRLLLGGPS